MTVTRVPLKSARLVAVAATVAMISGCASLGLVPPPGFDSEGVSLFQVTCADFASFEQKYRESGDEDLVYPLTTYTAEGATTWDTAADYYAAACSTVPSDTYLDSLSATFHDRTCADYTNLEAAAKTEWIDAWAAEYDVALEGRTTPDIVALFGEECAARGGSDAIWNASIGVGERMTMLLAHEWTDDDGYRYLFEFTRGQHECDVRHSGCSAR